MLKIAIILLIIWAGLSILGFVMKGLLWLGVVCLVLFVLTAIWGFVSGRSGAK